MKRSPCCDVSRSAWPPEPGPLVGERVLDQWPASAQRPGVGKINPFTVLLVIGLVLVGWYGFLTVPLYIDHLDVREAAEQIRNLVPASRSPEEAAGNPLRRLNSQVGWHYSVDEETGEERVLPGLGLTMDDNVTVDVDESGKQVTVVIDYTRTFQLKPLQRRQNFHFRAESKSKLE